MTTMQSIRLTAAALSCATGFAAVGLRAGGSVGILIAGAGSLIAGACLVAAGLHLRRSS